MEGKFQYKGQLDQYLEECLSSIGIQPDQGFLSDKDKQEYINIKGSATEEKIIRSQYPEVAISTTVVVKCSDAIKGTRVEVGGPLCGGLYKEDHGYIFP